MVSVDLERAEGALVWRVPRGWWGLSSAAVGGGLVRPRWVLNLGVGDDFTRTDLDRYASSRADGLGVSGPGTALLTAADVSQVVATEVDGLRVWATVASPSRHGRCRRSGLVTTVCPVGWATCPAPSTSWSS
ncbi:adenosylcobinamide amidohydrolase [Serinicoccus sp. CUA-874]|uniref:adenosylcobinamide amidohydrolase n=1 Tax=Serinicoccus sp. CUA-874 TaxID=1517939 RepID=UPI00096A5523|nr:adenosylcobinamide amidohydrolase [Serinicoccus sp. CUA-874]